ncbi:Maf-like protein pc0610 [Chlamydiales bacterium SCGC AB-751-O23]|jgi:septum formation protein|nr:Maf-like protein pc0610 [Chlamydiales bacterium SCGC AB-751-O23]
MQSKPFILGSSSPRRKEILSQFNLSFTCLSPDFDEDSITFKNCPENYVKAIALGKAKSIQKNKKKSIIIASDTTVYFRKKVFSKPKNKEQACSFLRTLSGKWHRVYSSVTCFNGKRFYTFCEETKVLFNDLSEKQIQFYVENFNCLDKAGAYMAQLPGAIIVKKIDGCFYNVMGLPINTLDKALKKAGISLWSA